MAALNPDDRLLAQVRRGDRAALAEVYDTYSPAVYRYLVRRTGDARVAEDLTGAVFLKLLEAVQKNQVWTTSFVGWLYRIAHNAVIDNFRRAARRSDRPLDELMHSRQEAPDQRAERAAYLQEIIAAMESLTGDQSQVLLLRFGEGLSHQEVAIIMGKSEGAIKLLQHRAIQTLRRVLQPESL
jgi:RNA polymerase sigma-70 factor (ECF subfamily)